MEKEFGGRERLLLGDLHCCSPNSSVHRILPHFHYFLFPCHIEFDFLFLFNYISTLVFLFLFIAFIKKNGIFIALSLII